MPPRCKSYNYCMNLFPVNSFWFANTMGSVYHIIWYVDIHFFDDTLYLFETFFSIFWHAIFFCRYTINSKAEAAVVLLLVVNALFQLQNVPLHDS